MMCAVDMSINLLLTKLTTLCSLISAFGLFVDTFSSDNAVHKLRVHIYLHIHIHLQTVAVQFSDGKRPPGCTKMIGITQISLFNPQLPALSIPFSIVAGRKTNQIANQ